MKLTQGQLKRLISDTLSESSTSNAPTSLSVQKEKLHDIADEIINSHGRRVAIGIFKMMLAEIS